MRWQVALLGGVALSTVLSGDVFAQRGGGGGGGGRGRGGMGATSLATGASGMGGGCQQQTASSTSTSTTSSLPVTASTQNSPMAQMAQQAYIQQMQMQQAYMRQLMMQQQIQNAQAALALQQAQMKTYEEAQQRRSEALANAAVNKRDRAANRSPQLASTKLARK